MHLECLLRHTYDVKNAAGEVTGTVVLAEVVLIHVHDGVAGAARGCGGGGGSGRAGAGAVHGGWAELFAPAFV